jgi:hypothetical protein
LHQKQCACTWGVNYASHRLRERHGLLFLHGNRCRGMKKAFRDHSGYNPLPITVATRNEYCAWSDDPVIQPEQGQDCTERQPRGHHEGVVQPFLAVVLEILKGILDALSSSEALSMCERLSSTGALPRQEKELEIWKGETCS